MTTSNKQLMTIQEDLFKVINKHLMSGVEPLAIAGMFGSTTLSLYRTLLPVEDYSAIVKYMYDARLEIKPINSPETLQ